MRLNFEGRSDDVGLPVVRLSPEAADRLFAAAKESRSDCGRRNWPMEKTGSFPFPNVSAQADIDLVLKKSEAHNVPGPFASARGDVDGDCRSSS